MRLATFIDGGPKTSFGTMMTRHSPSVSVTIRKEHVKDWEEILTGLLEDMEHDSGLEYPTDRSKPVPIVFRTSDLSDFLTNFDGDDWLTPYEEDLTYMTDLDPVGMGWVYLLKD